ncbi:hypothetical protein AYO21_00456 [Fonsecaea monophora]|uniref:Fumarylacetoacetase-like C-terminal domain-containing protein n=1 Tax=Fonsecaea monophora TaxID=254056 RepID=A0A177FLK5_9EURO|nr:hypothetical protein AYO21_00456 [Fonsecaea monophora]OAG45108.1 hypothetical protein AYO21_00456 [Fonsecaea monophora]
MAPSKFTRLLRFSNAEGTVFFGELGDEVANAEALIGRSVRVYSGNSPWEGEFTLTEKREKIAQLLSPVPYAPLLYGVGYNYKAHAAESSQKVPESEYPVCFTKAPGTLAGPLEDVPFSEELLYMDYEGELCVVIGKPLKNLKEGEDPTPYIAGYTVGNDVSSRYWQRAERSGGQHAQGKSFDKFAPIGPVLVSTSAIPDPNKLYLKTWVNGELRQESSTGLLIYSIPTVLRYLSRGVTLQPGTVLMTGTPAGVAASFRPQKWLQDGDVVEVEISGIGKIKNKMVLEK